MPPTLDRGGRAPRHVRPANIRGERIKRRRLQNRSGKRSVVVVLCQHGGRTLTRAILREAEGIPLPSYNHIYLTKNARDTLMRGITFVRDMGGNIPATWVWCRKAPMPTFC